LPLGELIIEHVVSLEYRAALGFISRSKLLSGQLHVDEIRQAAALDEHCRTCADQINREDFDVLLANSSIIQAVSPIGRYVKTAKVLYLQEPNRQLYEAWGDGLPWIAIPSVPRPWLRPRYWSWFLLNALGNQQLRTLARDERLNASAFDRILVNSRFSRESLLRAYGLDSTVCYLGVDTQMFADHRLPRDGFVVGLGEINRHKNVALIIQAVASIATPKPRLLWIGNASNDAYHQEMRHLAEASGVDFEARTNIADKELVEILNRASVMAYAPRLEPFGYAPLEANACGLPVVAVAEGGVRETIIDGVNGLLVAHHPEAMGNAIRRLLRDRQYAELLGSRGHQSVTQQWSLEAAVTRLEQELKAIAAAKASAN
jgi:glycosyltransferase involved in cell wall biosynthesis